MSHLARLPNTQQINTPISHDLERYKMQSKMEGELAENCQVQKGVKHGDILNTLLFNICLENVIRQPVSP